MIIGIIILVITAVIGIGVTVVKDEEFSNGTVFGMLITLMLLLGALFINIDITEPTPTAMDVYQGKTTLEITYKDGIPIDSVVVFKD
jgi:hypothetical protein